MKKCNEYLKLKVHDFSSWKVIEKGHITFSSLIKETKKVAFYLIQERICLKCNYHQIDYIQHPYEVLSVSYKEDPTDMAGKIYD